MAEQDINRFELVGNVGYSRLTPTRSGDVLAISLGTHRMTVDPVSNKSVERTDWHDVVAFGELATRIGESIHVGDRFYASGYMRTREWVDRLTGQKSYKHELVATVLEPRARHQIGAADISPAAESPELAFAELEIHRLS